MEHLARSAAQILRQRAGEGASLFVSTNSEYSCACVMYNLC